MRTHRTLIAMVAVGVLAVGCTDVDGDDDAKDSTPTPSAGTGDDKGDDEGDDKGSGGGAEGEELPRKVESAEEGLLGPSPTVTPEPPRDASTTDKVLHELKTRTLRMAGVEGRLDGSCAGGEITLEPGATTTCTVTYESVKVPWDVTIADSYKPGSIIFRYEAEPKKAPLTAKATYGKFHEQQKNLGNDTLRCSEIPDVVLVDYDSPTEYKCQYLIEGSGQDRWSDRVVSVGRTGVTFDLP